MGRVVGIESGWQRATPVNTGHDDEITLRQV